MKGVCIFIVAILIGGPACAEQRGVFPIDEKGSSGVSAFESDWYGGLLARLGEPSIMAVQTNVFAVYRFTLVPTWGNPVCVRLTISNGVARVEGKRLDGQGGYDPGELVEQGTTAVASEQLKRFSVLFEKLGFHELKTRDKDRGLDGSEWILEAADAGRYHIVVRWSPTAYDPRKRGTLDFVNVCECLYRISPLKADVRNKGKVELAK